MKNHFLRDRVAACLYLLLGTFLLSNVSIALAQTQVENEQRIREHLQSGEFGPATELATALPAHASQKWLGQISNQHLAAGSRNLAFETAGMIDDDRMRGQQFSNLGISDSSGSTSPANGAGNPIDGGLPNNNPGAGRGAAGNPQGGVTEADFTQLIDLITGTVATESWLDSGTGLGTIQAFPAGVFVDAKGTLHKLKVDSKRAIGAREKATFDSGNRQPQIPSQLRKISLTRLERAAELQTARGLPISETMKNLAGITSVEYVMVFPESGDIVIAGPAGPWRKDDRNRSVTVDNADPVLQLDDLIVCLRNAWGNNGKFGCSITPRQENLLATQEFLATTKLKGTSWTKALRETLGQQDVEVFGIDEQTHTARVLVEADYHMKLLGMGLEPSIPEVPSYLDRIKVNPDGSLTPMDVVRWWFTLNYDDVFADPAKTVFTFTGSGVKVLSENELLDEQGNRIHTGQSKGPTKAFARDFTRNFESLANQYPVYRELKNVFDMALVASLIRHQKLADQVDWKLSFFGDDTSSGRRIYQVQKDAAARQVDSVMNDRVIKVRKQSSTLRHTIVGVSGGISFDAHDAIGDDLIKTGDSEMLNDRTVDQLRPAADQENWWWD